MNIDNKSKWDEVNIRSLRLRLGWSQAEFARRLSLEPLDIQLMEKGQSSPTSFLCSELEVMRRQADQNNEERKQMALLDSAIDDRL